MKQTAFASFVAFWSVIVTLVVVHTLSPETVIADQPKQSITLDELAQHSSEDDCWMAIEGKVYDLSDYIPKHPTPPMIMTPWCGKDATEGMRTKGYGRDHSPAAWAMMEPYKVGVLEE